MSLSIAVRCPILFDGKYVFRLILARIESSLQKVLMRTCCADCRICVWNAVDGSLVHSLTGHDKQVGIFVWISEFQRLLYTQ